MINWMNLINENNHSKMEFTSMTISITFVLPSLFKSPKLKILSSSKTTLTSKTTSITFTIPSKLISPNISCV